MLSRDEVVNVSLSDQFDRTALLVDLSQTAEEHHRVRCNVCDSFALSEGQLTRARCRSRAPQEARPEASQGRRLDLPAWPQRSRPQSPADRNTLWQHRQSTP